MSEDFLGMSELERGLDFIGPIEYHAIRLYGRRVPYLTGTPISGGRIALHLDERFGVDVSVADAQWLVPFMANCVMVGMGYNGFPECDTEPTRRVVAPKMTEMSIEDPGES